MLKKTNNWIITIIILILLFIVGKQSDLFVLVGGETMTRIVPLQAQINQPFTVTYLTASTSGDWGATIVESITGGCTPITENTGWIHQTGDPTTYYATYTAPGTIGTCTFTGNYEFGNQGITPFTGDSITISTTTTTTTTLVEPTTTTIPPTTTTTTTTLEGTTTTTTIPCRTPADITPCDNTITYQEISAYADLWIVGTITRTELGCAIQAWANPGDLAQC